MDPVSMIVMALAAGAAAALKPTTESAVKDAYAGIKELIRRKYARVDLSPLEKKPESKTKQASVAEDLSDAGAANDQEVLAHAKTLLEAVERYSPDAAEVVGVNLEDIKGAALRIGDITSTGTGVNVQHADLTGNIEIKGVRAGGGGGSNP